MAEKIQFFPLDANYKVVEDKAVINLYGKTIDGRQICILDSNFEPYFYVIPKDNINLAEKLEKIKLEEQNASVTKTEAVIKKFLGKEVLALRVYTNLPVSVPAVRDVIKDWESILKKIVALLPMKKRTIDKLITQFSDITYTVIYAELFVALVQGIVGTIGFYLFGVPFPIILGIIMAFCALIPTIGTAIARTPGSTITFSAPTVAISTHAA